MRPTETDLEIIVAGGLHRVDALRLLFRGQENTSERVESALAMARAGSITLGGLFVALRQGQLVGSAWGQHLPGNCGVVWPSQVIRGETADVAERLMLAVGRYFAQVRIRFAQAALPQDTGRDAALLIAHGYRRISDLLYMTSERDVFPTSRPKCDLRFEPYRRVQRRRLENLVELTYEGSLDFAELNQVQRVGEALDGYEASGQFDAALWHFVQHRDAAGEDVGCVLLTDYAKEDSLELQYVGLVPTVRSRGWGIEITRFAQWLTRRAGRTRLVLAVSAENHPALAMYAASGFRVWDRRAVFLKVF